MKRIHCRVLSIALAGSVAAATVFVGARSFADDNGATPSIKKIMKIGFSGDKKNKVDPLCKVVATGKGTHETADQLLQLCKELAAAKPPKGDDADWKTRTDALVAAAEQLDKGDKPSKEAIAAFKSANDCKACHTEHRPPKKQQ